MTEFSGAFIQSASSKYVAGRARTQRTSPCQVPKPAMKSLQRYAGACGLSRGPNVQIMIASGDIFYKEYRQRNPTRSETGSATRPWVSSGSPSAPRVAAPLARGIRAHNQLKLLRLQARHCRTRLRRRPLTRSSPPNRPARSIPTAGEHRSPHAPRSRDPRPQAMCATEAISTSRSGFTRSARMQ